MVLPGGTGMTPSRWRRSSVAGNWCHAHAQPGVAAGDGLVRHAQPGLHGAGHAGFAATAGCSALMRFSFLLLYSSRRGKCQPDDSRRRASAHARRARHAARIQLMWSPAAAREDPARVIGTEKDCEFHHIKPANLREILFPVMRKEMIGRFCFSKRQAAADRPSLPADE